MPAASCVVSLKPLGHASNHPARIRSDKSNFVALLEHDALLLQMLAEVVLDAR
jgi:hypothetical protein